MLGEIKVPALSQRTREGRGTPVGAQRDIWDILSRGPSGNGRCAWGDQGPRPLAKDARRTGHPCWARVIFGTYCPVVLLGMEDVLGEIRVPALSRRTREGRGTPVGLG